jgi:hypothetical protein
VSPYDVLSGPFASDRFVCNDQAEYECLNLDQVQWDPLDPGDADKPKCHGACGAEDPATGVVVYEDCEQATDPPPADDDAEVGLLICESWFDPTQGYQFSTRMQCDGDQITKTYYTDQTCTTLDPNQPSDIYTSPHLETVGYFAGTVFECANVAGFVCENEDRVGLQGPDMNTFCHGGCGQLDGDLNYYEEPCENVGVDPVPPSDGALICEPWYDQTNGEFVFATQIQCQNIPLVGEDVTITYFVDEFCTFQHPTQPSGTFPSPHEETSGFFGGTVFQCINVAGWDCENEDRVELRGLVGDGTCHGGCGQLDGNNNYFEETCEPFGTDPVPEESQLLCESWFDQSSGFFIFATEMQCIGEAVTKTYFSDSLCIAQDPTLPSGTYLSPYLENDGYFTGTTLQCPNVAAFNCENEDRVAFSFELGASPCHGGCGFFDAGGDYVAEPCETAGNDPVPPPPVPPSGGELICEPWFDVSSGAFVFATEMQCSGSSVTKNYFLDQTCTTLDTSQPSGTYSSPYEETAGFFVGFTLECSNVAGFSCENEDRVGFATFGISAFCHGGCGALDANGNYFEEPCANAPGGGGNGSDDGDYVGGIVGGMFACGAAIGLAVGGAVWYDKKKRQTRSGSRSLLGQPPVSAGASFGPGVEMGESNPSISQKYKEIE